MERKNLDKDQPEKLGKPLPMSRQFLAAMRLNAMSRKVKWIDPFNNAATN